MSQTLEQTAPESLRYPIGRFARPEAYDPAAVAKALAAIEALPRKLLALSSDLHGKELDRRYRQGGWTIRQLINHIADANVNNYTRFKFALTEANPVIKPYLEALWSDLPDAKSGDVRPALDMLTGVHAKWAQSLRAMGEADFRKTFHHPDHKRDIPLFEAVAMYAWHGEHHLAHIRLAIEHPAP